MIDVFPWGNQGESYAVVEIPKSGLGSKFITQVYSTGHSLDEALNICFDLLYEE